MPCFVAFLVEPFGFLHGSVHTDAIRAMYCKETATTQKESIVDTVKAKSDKIEGGKHVITNLLNNY